MSKNVVLGDTLETDILRYVDSSGVQHIIADGTSNAIIRKEALKQASALRPYIDSLSSALSVKPKQIEGATTITSTVTADRVAFLEKKVDSLMKVTYSYKDKYLTLSVRTPDPQDTSDKGEFDFAYDANLNITQYFRRKWFLASKQSYMDIYSTDPRVKINGVKTFRVVQPQPAFGARLQASGAYNPILKSASFGPSIRVDLGNFSIRGTYYYNFQSKEWRPTLSADYSIITL